MIANQAVLKKDSYWCMFNKEETEEKRKLFKGCTFCEDCDILIRGPDTIYRGPKTLQIVIRLPETVTTEDEEGRLRRKTEEETAAEHAEYERSCPGQFVYFQPGQFPEEVTGAMPDTIAPTVEMGNFHLDAYRVPSSIPKICLLNGQSGVMLDSGLSVCEPTLYGGRQPKMPDGGVLANATYNTFVKHIE